MANPSDKYRNGGITSEMTATQKLKQIENDNNRREMLSGISNGVQKGLADILNSQAGRTSLANELKTRAIDDYTRKIYDAPTDTDAYKIYQAEKDNPDMLHWSEKADIFRNARAMRNQHIANNIVPSGGLADHAYQQPNTVDDVYAYLRQR